MKPAEFVQRVQTKVAISAVGPSTVRGQGKGLVRCAQAFLAAMDLRRVPRSTELNYLRWLDRQTETLAAAFPSRSKKWGVARKVLNIFLRDVLYNRYLCREYPFAAVEPWLELPLDGVVARELKRLAGRGALPAWPGLKRLTPLDHATYQQFARSLARNRRITRVHLDIYLWVDNR